MLTSIVSEVWERQSELAAYQPPHVLTAPMAGLVYLSTAHEMLVSGRYDQGADIGAQNKGFSEQASVTSQPPGLAISSADVAFVSLNPYVCRQSQLALPVQH